MVIIKVMRLLIIILGISLGLFGVCSVIGILYSIITNSINNIIIFLVTTFISFVGCFICSVFEEQLK